MCTSTSLWLARAMDSFLVSVLFGARSIGLRETEGGHGESREKKKKGKGKAACGRAQRSTRTNDEQRPGDSDVDVPSTSGSGSALSSPPREHVAATQTQTAKQSN